MARKAGKTKKEETSSEENNVPNVSEQDNFSTNPSDGDNPLEDDNQDIENTQEKPETTEIDEEQQKENPSDGDESLDVGDSQGKKYTAISGIKDAREWRQKVLARRKPEMREALTEIASLKNRITLLESIIVELGGEVPLDSDNDSK